MRTAYISHRDCLGHDNGSGHPEGPGRLHGIEDALIAGGLMNVLRHFDAPPASREQLARVHQTAYLDRIEALAAGGERTFLDPDTPFGPGSLPAALRAAGAAVEAVERIMAGEVDDAFCAVRPPGHHAEPGRAMGFCIFNNVAVGVAHALEAHGLERVAVVDFDVHHGNGTEVMFRDDERVLFCSTFRHPFYPHTPLLEGHPRIIHAPLTGGGYSEEFQEAVSERWLPALEAFAPQMIFVCAGFDAHFEDEMGGLHLLESDYFWVTREIVRLAARHAGGRIVSTLEGGYRPDALGRSVVQHIRALMGLAAHGRP
ncbi:histone deacetylase family protein [Endothiovibrio diazotrophicus]